MAVSYKNQFHNSTRIIKLERIEKPYRAAKVQVEDEVEVKTERREKTKRWPIKLNTGTSGTRKPRSSSESRNAPAERKKKKRLTEYG